MENIPPKGRIIVVANHSSYLDPIVVGIAISRHLRWVVRKDVFDVWWLRWLFALAGVIKENGSVDKAVYLLQKGEAIGIFPEGGRSPDGKLGEGKRGAAIMALKTGAEVIPCGVTGAFEAFPSGAAFPMPFPVKIKIGKAIWLGKFEAPDEDTIDSALKKIMVAIRSLMEK